MKYYDYCGGDFCKQNFEVGGIENKENKKCKGEKLQYLSTHNLMIEKSFSHYSLKLNNNWSI